MSEENVIKSARDGIAVVGEIIKAAGDSPQVKEAAGNLGQAAVTLTRTVNNVLLPLAAINFAFDKARAYFNGKFQQELGEKTALIPPESIVEPKASIAGPTLQGLAFTHEEPSLKDMYLNILATAMDGRKMTNAHPSFVEIIKQLDADDANLIRAPLQSLVAIPIVQLRTTTVGLEGYHIRASHLLDLCGGPDGKLPIEDLRLPAMIDNWSRLGLVEVDYNKHLTAPKSYKWVEQRPELIRLKQGEETDITKVTYHKGILIRTHFGVQFARAVGLLS